MVEHQPAAEAPRELERDGVLGGCIVRVAALNGTVIALLGLYGLLEGKDSHAATASAVLTKILGSGAARIRRSSRPCSMSSARRTCASSSSRTLVLCPGRITIPLRPALNHSPGHRGAPAAARPSAA